MLKADVECLPTMGTGFHWLLKEEDNREMVSFEFPLRWMFIEFT